MAVASRAVLDRFGEGRAVTRHDEKEKQGAGTEYVHF